jgi:hypothetical protein
MRRGNDYFCRPSRGLDPNRVATPGSRPGLVSSAPNGASFSNIIIQNSKGQGSTL